MWIGILVIIGGGGYLIWSLTTGKILVTLGTDMHKQTRLVDREDRPTTFWIAWVTSLVVMIIFAGYFIRTAIG